MILSDREILAALARNAIRITPDPTIEPSLWSSTVLDLRLGDHLACWDFARAGAPLRFLARGSRPQFARSHRSVHSFVVLSGAGVALEPGHFYLGWTLEAIQLPHRSRVAARVEGKSSLARLGLGIHVTAPTIHAGFGHSDVDPAWMGNPIQLEIWNTGPLPVVLKPGMKICQLIFEWVDGTPEQGYRGQFTVQGPGTLPSPPITSSPPARKRRRR